jgi:lipopolysaccharide/colanic/teichoic acid biosynthesis glycosyltransferase
MFPPEPSGVLHLHGRPSRMVVAGMTHVFDKIVAIMALVLAAPVFAGMALVIRRRSPGPMFRTRRRIGVNGSVFRMLEFRTTRPHAVLTALPQLINVLRGEMSVIGPRAPRPEELARELRVRPGIISPR